MPGFPEAPPILLLRKILKEVHESLRLFKALPPDTGPHTLALSADGMNLRLTPVQSLILLLIGLSRGLDKPPDAEAIGLLKRLLEGEGGTPQLWLPPGARIEGEGDNLTVHFDGPITTVLMVAGRRSGKTTVASILLAWLARRMVFDRKYVSSFHLLPNSRISVLNVACDEQQAKILFGMLVENLRRLGLGPQGMAPTQRMNLGANGRVQVESLCSSSRTVRGRTAIGVCIDEFAHFQRTFGPLSDRAMWGAIVPSVATFGREGLVIIGTSPAGRSGVVWDLFQERGTRPGLLTLQVPTWVMNPMVPRDLIDCEYSRDENLARQEYGAEFLAPRGRYLSREDILACVRPADPMDMNLMARRHIHVDLGLVHDSTAIALCRIEGQPGLCSEADGFSVPDWRIIVERLETFQGSPDQPLSLEGVEGQITKMIAELPPESAATVQVSFDQHQSSYMVERLKKAGINAILVPATEKLNQESYGLLHFLITSRRIALPDNPRLLDELAGLECTPTPRGMRVEAPVGGTDDCADALAVCAWRLVCSMSEWKDIFDIVDG
jgi:hypothetical protein